MRRIFSVFLVIVIALMLSACTQNNAGENTETTAGITVPSYENNMSNGMKGSIMGSWTVTMNKVDFIYIFRESTGTIKIGDETENIIPFYSTDSEFVWKVENRNTYFAYKPQVKDSKLILTPLYFIKDGQKYMDEGGKDIILTKND